MINTLFASIKKEWNLMIKEKMIFIVIFIIPLCANLLLGYEFNKDQIQNIPMVIYDQDNSQLSRMVVQQFRENKIFNVKYFVNNSDSVKKLIDDSKARVGMIIPKDFSKDIVESQSPQILMVYDGSHMPITAVAKGKASEILMTLRTGIFIKKLEGKLNLPESIAMNIAQGVKFRNRILHNPAKSYKNFLNIGIGTAIIQSAIALMSVVAIRRNEIPKIKNKRILYLVGKIAFYSLLGWISFMINILIQIKLFNIPFRGSIFDVAILSGALSFAVASFGIMVSTWVKDKSLATIINAVIFVPNTIMVGYTWPTISMPKPYQIVSNFYPFYHYADNLRDIFLKGIIFSSIKRDVMWLLGFAIITIFLSIFRLLLTKSRDVEEENSFQKEGENIALS